MTTITPPSGPQALPTTPNVAPVVVVPSPPPALARLPIGQLLQVSVTTQSGKDVFQVQTPLGQMSIQTALPLPKGSALVLQLQALSPVAQFQVTNLNGTPPPLASKFGNAATLASAIAARTAEKTTGHSQSATIAKLTPGSILQATVLRPTAQSMSHPPQSGSPQATGPSTTPNPATATTAPKGGALAGQTSPLRGVSKLSGTPTPGISKARGQGPTQASPTQGATKAAPGIAAKGSAMLPPGSQLSVRISGVQIPNPATSSPSPAASAELAAKPTISAGTSLSGTVTGSTPAGHTIVQTRAGVFALSTQTVVPRGSIVELVVVNTPTTPMPRQGENQTLHQTLFASRRWPALEQIMLTLHETQPTTAQHLMSNVVPRLDAGLTSSLIFFLSALRGGDLRSWLGEAPLRLIERSRPALSGRLREDFSALARLAEEPNSGDWRVALIPINTGAEIEQIRLLLRQHDSDEDDDNGSADSRFVIDVQLSTFGRLQLDGLVRHNGKSLDLIIRTEAPLSETMHHDIQTIFLDAAELTGLKGGVNFQSAPALFIDVPDPSGDHPLGLVV